MARGGPFGPSGESWQWTQRVLGEAGGELQSQNRAKIMLMPDLPFQGGLVAFQLLLDCPFLKEITPHLLDLQSNKEKEKREKQPQ